MKGIVTLRLFKVYIFLLVEWGFLSLLLFLPNDAWSISPNLMEVLQTQDTSKLPLPIPYSTDSQQSPLFLSRPSNVTEVVEYDPLTKQYIVYEKVGQYNIALPKVMSADEYRQYRIEKAMRDYWKQKQTGETTGKGDGILPRIQVQSETFDRVFGNNTIEIIPQGSAELIFGITSAKTENPAIAVDQRRNTTFDFQSKIQMNVAGKIGDKLKMEVNYNTEATFDFENNVKVEYNGYEDEIIQRIEAGNVSLPLPGTLITGSQSLFGVKTQLKFGKLNVTSVLSKQNGETQVIQVKGGAQEHDFEIKADEYDANRHFFLSHYFRDSYNQALMYLPVINSRINITKIEVWVTNNTSNFDNARNIVAFTDLGEPSHLSCPNFVHSAGTGFAANASNDLYANLTSTYANIRDISKVNSTLLPLESLGFSGSRDYEKVEYARKLSSNDYTLNSALGYISLSSALKTDEVLAVAYEYTLDGITYKVGEFSTDGISAPQTLILKLLKGTNLSPSMMTWDLMMKNIYSMNAYQVSKDDFILDVLYQSNTKATPVNYIDEGAIAKKPLIRVLNLDNINSNGDAQSDGVYDFIDGVTINAASGKIIFPVLEPFGSDLASKIGNTGIASRYIYQELYDSTLTKARQIANKNKFTMSGSYKSSGGSEIYLNAMNIPKGSVVVTAGGVKLVEDIQYIVDYNLGTIRITDAGILESGTTITVSVESNALYSMQTKSLVGTHFDYNFSDNFNVGATIMNLTERPLTQKVSYGSEAISNTIWGLNTSFKTDSKFLTKMVDFLPFIETKEKSTLSIDAEFAQLLPGTAKATGGKIYLDDFEGSSTAIDIHSWVDWKLSSTPQGQPGLFPEGSYTDDLRYGYNRARLAWYYINTLFLRNTSLTPGYIRNNDKYQGSHWVREIYEKEIFPNRDAAEGEPTNISVLNMAFYPDERGPYNYDFENIDANGKLLNPASRWGGIMRNLSTTDFETSNVEYVEFWLMDPFVYDSTSSGGDFYINLGNISEDVLRDGRKSFESGMPTSSEMEMIDTTAWGRVPTKQYLPVGFSNESDGMRKYQDIGLDGLSGEDLDKDGVPDEQSFFQTYINQIRNRVTNEQVISETESDPSSDDYKYFLSSDFDQQKADILDRYKYFNNTENNSPIATSTSSSQSYSTPDVEELGSDITMNETESYYQYRVSLRPEDMVVGKNFITDVVTGEKDKILNKAVKWYQFKIPISEYENVIGSIEDFKSIRFMRMFMRGFTDTTILRFATLELVRGEWRKYNYSLVEGQEGMPSADLPSSSFAISTVNIEENNKRTPVNYVLPPGVDRVIDPSQSQVTQLNEQSMEYRIENLADGDAKSAYKTLNVDVRHYKYLKMDIHAEKIEGYALDDDEVTAFIRLGSDYSNNYYEYEVPLKLTPYKSNYNNNKESDREIVWPRDNLIDINLDDLVDLKLARNSAMRNSGSRVTLTTVYSMADGTNTMKVVGNPNLSEVKVVMIGIRNPAKSSNSDDDGMAKSVIAWFNELRLTNYDNDGGWAANTQVTAKLADLGTVTVAGSMYTPGFGSIDSKSNERSTDNHYEYDASTSLELGKFLPEKANVKIPMYAGISESVSNPEYNPLDPDVTMKQSLQGLSSSEQDSLKRLVQDYSRRRSINFTNVKIDKQSAKPHFWNISNFALSYSYSELYSRNVNTDHKIQRSVRGALTYNFNKQTKYITPFKNVSWLNSKYLRIIKDFNFSLFPSQVSFRTDLDRSYLEQQSRNLDNPNEIINPTYSKDFQWNRNYSLNWDLAQSLKLDFTASNTARIDEPDGMVDKRRDRDSYEHWRDSVWRNILKLGRNTLYNHQFNLTYNLPLNKIPMLDWTSTSARYTGTYRWEAGSILSDTSTFDLGNKIQNSNAIQLNGQLNMTNLFNKSGFLKRINQQFDQRARGAAPKTRIVKYEQEGINLRANVAKSITHKLKAEKVTVKVYDEKGKEVKVAVEIKNDQRLTIKADKENKNCRVVVEGKVPEKMSPLRFVAEGSVRLMMSVKTLSVAYTETNGTILPGFKPGSKFLGMDRYNGFDTPGWEFVLGMQDPDFAWKAAQNGWLTRDTSFNTSTHYNHTENLSFRSTIEPVPGFKIDLTANRVFARNRTETIRADVNGAYSSYSPVTSGSFSISVLTLGTAFEGKDRANHSKAFERMKNIRYDIAQRLYRQRIENGAHEIVDPSNPYPEYPVGYGPLSQDVLRTSFLAAYTNTPASRVTLRDFPLIPVPNWQITYDGLAKLKPFKNYFKTFTLSHGYRSLYTIGSYATNLSYEEENDGFSYARNLTGDFYPKNEITNVSINEQFSPLIGVDIGWQGNLTTRLEVKTSRVLAMSFSNTQLTETFGSEYIIGAGYRFENLPLIFESETGDKKALKSDLKVTLDFSLRNNTTVLRQIVEETNTITAGQLISTIKSSADYRISDQVTIRFYFDRVVNSPKVSKTYKTANTSFGFSVRFELVK